MKRLLLAICLAVVGLAGNPIVLAEEPQQVVEVTSNKLNIRTGAGQNYPVIYTLAKGQKLVVVNEQMSWLEVQLPPQISCWISKKFVEVKEGTGSAKDRINVRTKPDGDVIGQIAEGATVKVVEEKDKWLKIEIPENLTAWVNKKYTKYWGTYANYLDNQKSEQNKKERETELKEKFQEAEELKLKEENKPNLQQDFHTALELYRTVVENASNKELREKARDRIELLTPRQQLLDNYREAMAQKNKNTAEIEKRFNDRIAQLIREREKPALPYDAEGYVDAVGKLYKRPQPYKLTKGEEDLFFIKFPASFTDDDITAKYYKKLVGIRGKIVKTEGQWNLRTIIVDQIDTLE